MSEVYFYSMDINYIIERNLILYNITDILLGDIGIVLPSLLKAQI